MSILVNGQWQPTPLTRMKDGTLYDATRQVTFVDDKEASGAVGAFVIVKDNRDTGGYNLIPHDPPSCPPGQIWQVIGATDSIPSHPIYGCTSVGVSRISPLPAIPPLPVGTIESRPLPVRTIETRSSGLSAIPLIGPVIDSVSRAIGVNPIVVVIGGVVIGYFTLSGGGGKRGGW